MRAFLLFFLFLFAGVCTIALYLHSPAISFSQDLGRHLLTGNIIVHEHVVPKTNLFSYTYPTFPFINHHWFSEVTYYAMFTYLGVNALVIFSTLFVAISFWILLYENRKQNFVAILITLFFYFNILRERVDLRPELFSYLFLAIFITLLYRFKEKYTTLIFFLIPLQLLWVNMHIYFIIGIALTGFFLVDAFYISATSQKHKKILLGIFVGQILVSFINPNGLQAVLYPFTVLSNYGYTIEENQTVWFLWNYSQKPTIIWFIVSFILGCISFLFSRTKLRILDVSLFLFFSFLSFQAIRNFPLFVFGTFTILVTSLSSVVNTYFLKLIHKLTYYFFARIVCICFCIGIIIYTLLFLPKIPIGLHGNIEVKQGVDFFLTNNLQGPIFNNFDVGSYLEYRLYPKEKVFIDGRPEAYPKDFFQNIYIPMQENPTIFQKIDKKYNFNTIVFSHTDQTPWAKNFLSSIAKNITWQLIYLDDTIIIFIKNVPRNEIILQKFSTPQITYNSKNLISLYKLAMVLVKLEDANHLQKVSQEILDIDPKNCFALNYFRNTIPDNLYYQSMFNTYCIQ